MGRSRILPIAVLLVLAVFVVRLINIQLIDTRYTLDAANNAQRIEKIYAPRGLMRDRNGVVLATNQIAYDVEGDCEPINPFGHGGPGPSTERTAGGGAQAA